MYLYTNQDITTFELESYEVILLVSRSIKSNVNPFFINLDSVDEYFSLPCVYTIIKV